MRIRPLLTVVIVLTLLSLPESASAASVRVDTATDELCSKYQMCPSSLSFVAAPGEVNAVTYTRLSQARVRIQDSGAALQARAGCTPIDQHSADCVAGSSASSLQAGSIELADGADTATGLAGSVSGGQGSDTLTVEGGTAEGGAGDDVVACGPPPGVPPGPCFLDGGPGRDLISGGAGNDTMSGGRGTDALDGGDGADVLDYSDHRASVAVDLDAAVQVARVAGTLEPIQAFEAVRGGSGDDLLISPMGVTFRTVGFTYAPDPFVGFAMVGGAGNDRIHVRSPITADGGDGDDRITGLALSGRNHRPDTFFVPALGSTPTGFLGGRGNDRLTGERGDDVLAGGSGNDVLDGKGGQDGLSGDTGNDVLRGGGQDDLLLGGEGADRVFGGSGRDFVRAVEPSKRRAKDRVDCGTGRRDRAHVDGNDRVRRCERLTLRRSA